MLFQRISRTNPEQIFAIMKNVSGGNLVDGDLCVMDLGTADGVSVLNSGAAADLLHCVGVCSGTIINNEFGKIQVYGYHANVKAAAGVTAGAAIKSAAVTNSVQLGLAADQPVAQIGFAITATASSRIKAWLRLM